MKKTLRLQESGEKIRLRFLVTCEHASSAFPSQLLDRLPSHLPEHRFHDPGAADIAAEIARQLAVPLFSGTYSRLVADLNRSPHHPRCITLARNRAEKDHFLEQYWQPFRSRVQQHLNELLDDPAARVIHLSIHSFTPILDGTPRSTHIGLLYDPHRQEEKTLAQNCLNELRRDFPDLTIHANQPYRGISDGHISYLRQLHSPKRYLGYELEYASNLANTLAISFAVATKRSFAAGYDEQITE